MIGRGFDRERVQGFRPVADSLTSIVSRLRAPPERVMASERFRVWIPSRETEASALNLRAPSAEAAALRRFGLVARSKLAAITLTVFVRDESGAIQRFQCTTLPNGDTAAKPVRA